jgi:large subunit ribosomal protein L16
MLFPKKTKYRKAHRGRLKGISTRGSLISFGTYALKATTRGYVNSRQIEAARKTMSRYTKKGGKIWIRIFPDKPWTKNAEEVPMGKGKGDVQYYTFGVKPGRIIFEMDGIPENMAKEAMGLAADKLPVKTKFLIKV